MGRSKAQDSDQQALELSKHFLECLKNNPLFVNLPAEDVGRFQQAAQTRVHKKNKMLYVEEDSADYFYIILNGWIKLFRTTKDGEEVIIDMLTTGHMFGENALFVADKHSCSAQVVEKCQIVSIPSKLLREQIMVSSALALNMLYSLSRHHQDHSCDLAFNVILSAPQRIGCFLLRLCPKVENDAVIVYLPYDKNLIAKTLGMREATFSRALHILRQKTSIQIDCGRVEISSVAQLTEYVYGPFAVQ